MLSLYGVTFVCSVSLRQSPFSFLFLPFFLFPWRCRFFLSEYFCTITVFSLYVEYVVQVFSFRIVFFYLVTMGWIFDISLCENSIISINQSINVEPVRQGAVSI